MIYCLDHSIKRDRVQCNYMHSFLQITVYTLHHIYRLGKALHATIEVYCMSRLFTWEGDPDEQFVRLRSI